MDGNVRRLPTWMLPGASSSGVTAKGNPSDDKSVDVKRKREPEAPKSKPEKRPRRRTVKPKEKDDTEKPKKVKTRRRGEEQNLIVPDDEDLLTVDDLLSFAKEYVETEDKAGDEDDDRESMSISESNTTSSQIGTKESIAAIDSTKVDMLNLLLGPFFKKPQH